MNRTNSKNVAVKSTGRAAEMAAAANIGLWSLTHGSDRLECTAAFSALFGLSAGTEPSLDSLFNAVCDDDRKTIRAQAEDCIRNSVYLTCEFRRLLPDGTIRWIALRGAPLSPGNGYPIGYGGAAHDVTETKRIQEEQEQLLAREKRQREAAESANRVKDEFVALVSHELRSPLNAMLGWARILQTKQIDPPTLKHAVETIERSARAQSKLIEDLIDSARITTGKLRLETHPVDLKKVARTAIDIARPAAEAKQVEVIVKLDDAPLEVVGDADRLQQVVGNLLSNAVKFTPGGGRIEVDLHRLDGQAQVTVRDTGMGIDAELLPRIFDRFDQAGHTNTRRHGGLGLGLSLVRQLVELHGGSVRAESAGEGKGATFVVLLRLRPASNMSGGISPALGPAGTNTGPLNASAASLSGFNILVVDDDPDARELTAMLLQKNGASVRAASSAAEALSTLTTSTDFLPDLLLSDIGMPDEDGYSLMSRIRARSPACGGQMPAIALTAFGSQEDRARAFASGFDVHLTKPIEPDELLAQIANLAALGRARRK